MHNNTFNKNQYLLNLTKLIFNRWARGYLELRYLLICSFGISEPIDNKIKWFLIVTASVWESKFWVIYRWSSGKGFLKKRYKREYKEIYPGPIKRENE